MEEREGEKEGGSVREGRVIKSPKFNILWHQQHNGMHNRPYRHTLRTYKEGRERALNLNEPHTVRMHQVQQMRTAANDHSSQKRAFHGTDPIISAQNSSVYQYAPEGHNSENFYEYDASCIMQVVLPQCIATMKV